MIFPYFDIVVVGGGHAGAEAAAAASNLGCRVMLVTQVLDNICQMSCNPAIGGVAKGQIVREIDALGGYTGIVADMSALQFRMLNKSKGPAMWSPRAQCDRMKFSSEWRKILESIPNLSLWQDEVVGIKTDGNAVKAAITRLGNEIPCGAIILTSGTFLNGRIFIGEESMGGGRIGERQSEGLSDELKDLGFEVERLKTGTPVRVDGRTIDFSCLEIQRGDDVPCGFSFLERPSLKGQLPCYIANTNELTHLILRKGFDKSPMFTGRIKGVGPRYCPSIEDKIDRFSTKDHHQLFVEPEGRNTCSFYLNGFSSSLPLDVQVEALHSIRGFENAKIFKPGYAIEYDYFPPTQLTFTLETKRLENLYFAGQVNGTTGYEEAACQGLMAGINAALKLKGKAPFVLGRSQAYLGVLIDDLVTKGVDEPYRMFTSRAEYRILLRQDNADMRLTPLSYAIGLASEERMRRVELKEKRISEVEDALQSISITPTEANEKLLEKSSAMLSQRVRLTQLLQRPELDMEDMMALSGEFQSIVDAIENDIKDEVIEETEIMVKYNRYIEKEREVAERIIKFDSVPIPNDYDYHQLPALSYESREKLNRYHPSTLGQAARISGISPADISLLMVTFLNK